MDGSGAGTCSHNLSGHFRGVCKAQLSVLLWVSLQILLPWCQKVRSCMESHVQPHNIKPIQVWITTCKLDDSGLRYTLDTHDLIVIPWQFLAAYVPAIGSRLLVKAGS